MEIDQQLWHGAFFLAAGIKGEAKIQESERCTIMAFKTSEELEDSPSIRGVLQDIVALEPVAILESSFKRK